MAEFEGLKRTDGKWELRWGWSGDFLQMFKDNIPWQKRKPVKTHSDVTNRDDFYWLVDDSVMDDVFKLAEEHFDGVVEIEPREDGGDKITDHKTGRVMRQRGLF